MLDCTRSDSRAMLTNASFVGERGRVDSRHPDTSLVNLEQISDKIIEVDIGIGVVVECELVQVPKTVSIRSER